MNLPQRRHTLTRLWRVLRPGGWLLTEDYDTASPPPLLAAPDDAATAVHDRITRALSAVTDAAGIDRGWGSAAYTAFLTAGFVDVTAQLYARSTPAGTTGHDLLATYVRQLFTPMLDTGLMSESDADQLLEMVTDPRFVQWTPSLVSTWGRRPFPVDAGTARECGS